MKSNAEFKTRSWPRSKQLAVAPAALMLLALTGVRSLAQDYSVLHFFTGSDGQTPRGSLVLSGTTLYGTTCQGGIAGQGVLYALRTDGSEFRVIRTFTADSNGGYPLGRLLLSGTTLFGTTEVGGLGGNGGGGTLFKINTDGTGFTLLHMFTYASQAFWPEAGLIISGNTLYGTTENSASPNYGAVFSVNADGSDYRVLKTFQASDGANPRAELVLSGSTLFGTTSGHVYPGDGNVFKLNTDGSGFTILKELPHFGGINRLFSPLVLSGSTLYGTAAEDNYNGMVFRINTDGTGLSVLQMLTNSHGGWGWPGVAGPVLSGTTLYATTSGSDARWGADSLSTNNPGTVFQLNTDGNGYTVLKNFTFLDGANPGAPLLLAGGRLYGTTKYGGISNSGVVFVLSVLPTIVGPPPSQTAEIGSLVAFRVQAHAGLLAYQWCFEGRPLTGCTNSSLALPGVQPSQSGAYTVVVTNAGGSVTSVPAMLNVIAPVERRLVPGIELTGETGASLNVEYTEALRPATWLPLDTVTLRSPPQWCFDTSTPLPPQRFYRAWQTGVPAVAPSMQMPSLIPALLLTGSLGNQVRVDGINVIGPTDAWFTLATVTLTNTTLLYFDVTAPGQPTRLYRLVPVP